jgi:hypothetical protein
VIEFLFTPTEVGSRVDKKIKGKHTHNHGPLWKESEMTIKIMTESEIQKLRIITAVFLGFFLIKALWK